MQLLDFTNPTSFVVLFFVAFVALIILIPTASYFLDKLMTRAERKRQEVAVVKPCKEPKKLVLKPMALATA